MSPGLGRLGVTSQQIPLPALPANPAAISALHVLLCVWQLDQICISFDNGKTTMNFVEAALLIQGSACIYSRKVRSWRPQPCPGPGSAEAEPSGGCPGDLEGLSVATTCGNERM